MTTLEFNTPRGPEGGQGTFKALASELALDDRQIAEARVAGVTNTAEFASFLMQSTHLADEGVFNVANLTARLAVDESASTVLLTENVAPESFALGARAPTGALFAEEGQKVPSLSSDDIRVLASFAEGPLANQDPVFATVCEDWPVRNQGSRGTCVSFATCAAYELFLCNSENVQPDLSEQFLYWAIKHHNLDPWPNKDGTWHRHAVTALANYGAVRESEWRYNPTPMVGSVSHNPPPAGSEISAQSLITTQPVVQSYTSNGNAAHLLSLLQNHNGVAIALPVFRPPVGGGHNWNSNVARSFGFVQSPGPSWAVDGGHAVLCVGFVPDPDEPIGGHFIIRNSWGTSWGANLPHPDYAGPEPGYGQIPASYIDNYLWETCVF